MNNREQTINSSDLNDMTVADDQQSQIKGGPTPLSRRDIILKSSVAEQESVLGDLEPAGDVKGGPLSGLKLNHNETVASDADNEDEAQTAKLCDDPQPVRIISV